ncbi:MAG: MarR family winged helix-turn-helix transcriptional regulator [Actinomycetota bacterium]
MDDVHEEAWRALVDLYQEVLRPVVARLEAETGLDAGVYSALAYLDRVGGRAPLARLQELLRVRYSQPGVSRLVQRMEANALVDRRPDPRDARAAVVVLTPAGRGRYRRAERVYRGALGEHFATRIDRASATALVELLGDARDEVGATVRGKLRGEGGHVVRP